MRDAPWSDHLREKAGDRETKQMKRRGSTVREGIFITYGTLQVFHPDD